MPATRKVLKFGDEAETGLSSPCGLVRTTLIADGGADLIGEIFAQDDGRICSIAPD